MIALALGGLLACPAVQELRTQERWELIAINQDLSVLDAQLTVGNTGWLRGQGTVSLDWLIRDQSPLRFLRTGLPEETETLTHGGLLVGPDALRHEDDGTWTLAIRDAETRAQLTLRPFLGGPAPVPWPEAPDAWTVAAPVVLGEVQGMVASGSRSTLVDARGVLTRRRGDSPPALRGTARLAVYVLGEGVAIGLDGSGPQAMSWAVVGDLALDARDARLTRGKQKGRLVLDLRPTADLVAHILPRQPRAVRSPWTHLHRLERWVLGAWLGTPTRRTQGARAQLVMGGERSEARAVIVEERFE